MSQVLSNQRTSSQLFDNRLSTNNPKAVKELRAQYVEHPNGLRDIRKTGAVISWRKSARLPDKP